MLKSIKVLIECALKIGLHEWCSLNNEDLYGKKVNKTGTRKRGDTKENTFRLIGWREAETPIDLLEINENSYG